MTSRPPLKNRSRQRGVALLEGLVAILIFSLGVLAMVGLQSTMAKATLNAELRAEATTLATKLMGHMWGDIPNLSAYATGANPNMKDWLEEVAKLPGGKAEVEVVGNQVTITITWQPANEEEHNYSVSTFIL